MFIYGKNKYIFVTCLKFSLLILFVQSWRDLKTKVSKKSSNLRHAKRQTGNKTIELQELNELEKKVMGIIGHEYVEGTACPESFPDEVVCHLICYFSVFSNHQLFKNY